MEKNVSATAANRLSGGLGALRALHMNYAWLAHASRISVPGSTMNYRHQPCGRRGNLQRSVSTSAEFTLSSTRSRSVSSEVLALSGQPKHVMR
ncbi:hypothetical protein A0H81_02083 [Grifola frondosa]|uniref:Uncharacterized protein n=1 Tax=Grifola frondosa TaxID=5627 RepID=A0A1C7MQW6_GRIFR|nr:hypothetical protein A0H81_02083 [Grifola frondosa]